MSLRVLIADDELPAREKVARLLLEDRRFQLVGEARDGIDALELIERLAPDVVMLDIQMPGLDGFQVLDALGGAIRFSVVFSTAFDDHALRAFEAHAVDYLLKPYDAARFGRAMDKAVAQQAILSDQTRRLVADALSNRPRQLTLKSAAGGWITLPRDAVLCVRAENKHSHLVLAAERHTVRRPLRELEAILGDDFVRVHRKELVNVRAVVRVEPLTHGDALLVFENEATSVLTRTYRSGFLERWRR